MSKQPKKVRKTIDLSIETDAKLGIIALRNNVNAKSLIETVLTTFANEEITDEQLDFVLHKKDPNIQ